jgi:hypothetical protein
MKARLIFVKEESVSEKWIFLLGRVSPESEDEARKAGQRREVKQGHEAALREGP